MRICLVACISLFYVGMAHAEFQGPPADIHWFEWGEKAFQKAHAEDKLILLDLMAVWCHACHVMDQSTYVDAEIVRIVNGEFIPIRVDSDQRPDLSARYRTGGWPTTSILLPSGEILFQANALEPDEMRQILKEVQIVYSKEREDLKQQARLLWDRVQSRKSSSAASESMIQPSMVDQSVSFMKNQFDVQYGGFREAPKFFEPEAVRLALALGFVNQDPSLTNMGLHTLKQQTALQDPVWGGFYRYAERADWTDPHFEKMLTIQARNLQNYIEAFQFSEDPVYQTTARSIVDYVWRFLTDHQRGRFFESQDADLRAPSGDTLLRGKVYFQLTEEERVKRGIPLVDHRIFTGSNALMADAFLTASWVLARPDLRTFSLKVIRELFAERWDAEQGLHHIPQTEKGYVSGLLSDHVRMGQALVTAFQVTGDRMFLDKAETLAQNTQTLLEDRANGGFFDRLSDANHQGLLKMSVKPAVENLYVILWYLDLFQLTQNQRYRSAAGRAFQSVASGSGPLPIALMGQAVDRWFRDSVHVAIVGDPVAPVTEELMEAGMRVFFPGKLIRKFNPNDGPPQWGVITFPYDGRPAAFACSARLCSPPVFSPTDLQSSLWNLATLQRDPG